MSLETCDDGHEQIVYECTGRTQCPVCGLIKEHNASTEEYAKKIDDLQEEVNTLSETVDELQVKLEEANAWAKERFTKSDSPERVVPKPKGEL